MSTYSSLANKYASFSIPAYKISCGGSELSLSEFIITEIVVDNAIGRTAGAARFTVTNIYEPGSRNFSADISGKLSPGSKVSVSLGYGSDTSKVFMGYIDELKVRFDDEQMSLTALCLDARGLMRGGSSFAAHKEKKVEDIVTEVLDKYGALVTSKDISLNAWEQEVNVTQSGGDLEYVCEAAQSHGALFYIDCGKAVIGPAQDTVCVEFDWGQFELDFSICYLDEKLKILGYDARNMEAFSAESTSKQTANQEQLISVEGMIRLPYHLNAEAAKGYAAAVASNKAAEAIRGSIRCVGIPEVKVGQKVKINKFPLEALGLSSELTVKSVSHSMDGEHGFSTVIGV